MNECVLLLLQEYYELVLRADPFSTCDTPGTQVTHIPKGTLYRMYDTMIRNAYRGDVDLAFDYVSSEALLLVCGNAKLYPHRREGSYCCCCSLLPAQQMRSDGCRT